MELSTMEKMYTPESESVELTEMSVYHALSQRKIYADRLEKLKGELDRSGFVMVKRQSEMKDAAEMEKLTNGLKSKYDETISLFRNFYALNAAIQQSNATTKVVIADKEYTMAEAISRYDRINAEISFYNGIAVNIATAVGKMEDSNQKMLKQDTIDTYVNNAIKSMPEGTINGEDEMTRMRDNLKERYVQENTSVLVDPYDLRSKIEGILKGLREFSAQFNEMMNATNLTTKIYVNLIKD